MRKFDILALSCCKYPCKIKVGIPGGIGGNPRGMGGIPGGIGGIPCMSVGIPGREGGIPGGIGGIPYMLVAIPGGKSISQVVVKIPEVGKFGSVL